MNDFEKILEETEKAVRLEYNLLSAHEPVERRDIFVERLHGALCVLVTVNLVLNQDNPEGLKAASEKITELMHILTDETYENYWEEARNESVFNNEG